MMEQNNLEVTTERMRDLNLNSISTNNINQINCDDGQKFVGSTENLEFQAESFLQLQLTEISKTNEQKISASAARLAGHVKAVMMSTVVIQRAPGSRIVDCGTAIYLLQKNICPDEPLRKIGTVSDVFGSVNDPMYTVELTVEEESSLKIDSTAVYYLLNDPKIRFINVECDHQGHYKITKFNC